MPLGGLLIGGAMSLGSSVIGGAKAGAMQDKAQQALEQAAQQYLSLTVPDVAQQQLILEHYKRTGKMDPRLAKAFQQAQTKLSTIRTNPALESAQMDALASLENQAHNGGHTLAGDAYLNKVQQDVNTRNHGRQGAIEQSFAAKGMGQPSGLMLSAMEENNQNMTGKENDASLQTAADAQKTALRALESGGEMAGKIRSQDYNQAADAARATDSINQFNTQMSQGVENANVAATNRAREFNLNEDQRVADQNVGLNNYQQQHNKGLVQQEFQNKLQKAGGAAAAYNGQAGQYNNQANTAANTWGNVGQGLLKTGVGVGKTIANQKKDEDDYGGW